MSAPQTITTWVCDECGYWRQQRSTGVHQTSSADLRGKMVIHELRPAEYVLAARPEEETA